MQCSKFRTALDSVHNILNSIEAFEAQPYLTFTPFNRQNLVRKRGQSIFATKL